MTLWRISNHPLLDGGGGMKAGGRWHTKGRPIVYCAGSPAAALLEVLVHFELEFDALPVRHQYLKIEAPDDLEVEEVPLESLARGWQGDVSRTRRLGDEWLRSGRSALLRVPSALTPESWNVLINPRQAAAARIQVHSVIRHALDPRLHRLRR